mmetsp:Transcript_10740/g.25976  ORF Transcript_10740/g.25976 Transcript_10740/m.25976 type:complete len:855 (-) Transcript_10740:65-2629(-)
MNHPLHNHSPESSPSQNKQEQPPQASNNLPSATNELRKLVDNANAPIFGIDVNGNVNEWNYKTAEITGFSKEEATGKPFVQTFVAAPLQQSVKAMLDRALKGDETSNYQLEFCTKTNETRFLLVNASTRRNAHDNTVIGVVGVAQDVTETTKHDRAVAAMARELRQLIDKANAPIFGIDVHGQVNEWNDKTAEITGFSKLEALQKPLVSTFIVPKLRQSVKDVMDQALLGDETSNYELEFRTKNKEIRHLLVNATTRRDAEHKVVGVVGVAQDVTEAVERDAKMGAMARELRQLVDSANAPIFGIDKNGNVNEWNDKTAEITGFSKKEAWQKPLVSTFIVPKLRKSVQDVLDRALQGDETSNYQLEFCTKTKETRYLLVNATTRRDTESNIVGVVGVAQDVTDDRRHSEQLRQMQYLQASQEAKLETERNMTAYFAHELRNPLHAIDCALKLMPIASSNSTESTELVNSMTQCASFMSSIMNNLLDVRKMEEGKMVLDVMPLSLSSLVQRVKTMLLPSVRSGVKLITHCDLKNNNDFVMGDAHRIQQVLTNVITNAIKYTATGSIVVSVMVRPNTADDDDNKKKVAVRFEVTDTGPGIPPNAQSELFQRFVQRGGAPGTGLGLAIAKHLVDLTGGHIFFESDPSIKPGTTCIVEMPLEQCDQPTTAAAMAAAMLEEEQDDENALIEDEISLLIIDDVRVNRSMFRRRVAKRIAPKAKITEAATGEAALELCKQKKFDVILVDQHMEEAGGVLLGTETVVAMRRRKLDSVIVGCSGNDIDQQFMEAGTDWVMKKPTPPNHVIVGKLRHLLALRRKKIEEREGTPAESVMDVSKRKLGLSVCPPLRTPTFKKQKVV